MKYFVHESAIVDDNVTIGEGTKIWHFSHILSNTTIGNDCVFGQNVMAGPEVTIGNNCKIQNNVSIYKCVELEDDVFCGPSMVFTNVIIPRAFIERKHAFKNTLVKKGATIGANATVICGNTIGRFSMVGAGTLITKNVPDYALFLGVPGKHSGWVCECGVVMTRQCVAETLSKFTCSECGKRYSLIDDKFEEI